jgi:hypothetical protein
VDKKLGVPDWDTLMCAKVTFRSTPRRMMYLVLQSCRSGLDWDLVDTIEGSGFIMPRGLRRQELTNAEFSLFKG